MDEKIVLEFPFIDYFKVTQRTEEEVDVYLKDKMSNVIDELDRMDYERRELNGD